jgi:predicted peroxiredoxin
MQSFVGLMGSRDPAIIPETSCSASVVRHGHVSCHRHKRGQIKNHDQECLGSDDPTKTAFPFLHGDALSEAGHQVQIFLLGEAVSLMRKPVANAVVRVGWRPLSEALAKIAAKKIPIYACGACSRARGVTETDLNEYGAKFGNPKIFVSLVEWADKIITE